MTGWIRYAVIGLAALALIAGIVVGVRGCKKDEYNQENQAINLGGQSERAATQGEVLNHVQKANDAARAPTNEQLNSVCSQYDRNCPKSHK
ncbi:MAG TPA: hypothetical protein VLG09_04010 [Candidatus Saccharimonadales bacterium]|nr:hypothetical protein [Candidatus Saccharimonadales bacterium]